MNRAPELGCASMVDKDVPEGAPQRATSRAVQMGWRSVRSIRQQDFAKVPVSVDSSASVTRV